MVTSPEQEAVLGEGSPHVVHRLDWLLLVAFSIEAMGYGAIFALLAELQDTYGFSSGGLGLIAGTAFLSGLITQLTIARYADRGHSRLMLRAGLLVAGVGMLGFGLSTELWQFIAMRLLLGIGAGAFMSAARRILVLRDISRTGETIGRLTACEVAGFISGPPVAAAIAHFFGLSAPFIVLAVALALTSPAVARIEEPPWGEQPERKALRVLLRRRGVRAGLAVAAAWALSMGVFDAIWARFLTDRGATTLFVGVSLAIFAAPLVLLSPAGGRLADRVGASRAAVLSMALTVPVMVLYGFFDGIWMLCAIAFLHSTIDAVTLPASRIAVARSAPPELLATGQGLSGGINALVGFVAAVSAPLLYEHWGAGAMWGAAAAGIAVLSVLAAAWGRGGYAAAAPGRGPAVGGSE